MWKMTGWIKIASALISLLITSGCGIQFQSKTSKVAGMDLSLQVAPPPRRPAARDLWASPTSLRDNSISIEDYGASPDRAPSDNSKSIQAALDALAGKSSSNPVLFIPARMKPYVVDRTLFVPDGVTVQGSGRASMLSAAPGMRAPVLQFGIERQGLNGSGIGAEHRIPLVGILDGSVSEARFGLLTLGNTYGWFQATPLNLGLINQGAADYWDSATKLTIDTILNLPANLAPESMLFGMSDNANPPSPLPWFLSTGDSAHPNSLQFAFKTLTSDDRFPDPKGDYRFFFSLGASAAGRHRISIELDLQAGRVAAFVDGAEVATTSVMDRCSAADPASCRFSSGNKKFWPNNRVPFGIGATGSYGPMGLAAPITNFELDGLKLTADWRYSDNGVGSRQALVSGQPVNDFTRCFSGRAEGESNVIALLPLKEDPADNSSGGQMLYVYDGDIGWNSSGLFLRSDFDYRSRFTLNALRNLRVTGVSGGSPTVAVGPVAKLTVDNVGIAGGLQGIGSFPNTLPSNPRRIELQLIDASAPDATLYFSFSDVFAQSLNLNEYQGAALRLEAASATVTDLLATPWTDSSFGRLEAYAGPYGGNYLFKNISLDAEGTRARTAVYVESSASHPTSLTFNTFNGGIVDYCDPNPSHGHPVSGNTFVMLRQTSNQDQPANLYARNLYFFNPFSDLAYAKSCAASLFEVDGPAWRGALPNQGFSAQVQTMILHLTPRFGNVTNLQVDTSSPAFMSAGNWPEEDLKARVSSIAPPLEIGGPTVADIRNFGASPQATSDVNRRAIQAAVTWMADKLADNPLGVTGTIYIPAGSFSINDTIYVDQPAISFRGEGGRTSRLVMDTDKKVPVLYFGPRRSEFPGGLSGSFPYRVDLSNKLDASVANDPQKRYGIRTNGDSYVIFQTSPLNLGPLSGGNVPTYWQSTRQLTFDFVIDPPSGGFPLNTTLFGIGNLDGDIGFGRTNPYSFMINDSDPSVLRAMFTMSDAQGENRRTIDEYFKMGDATKMHRISVQVDLDGKRFMAFSDGVQVASHALDLGNSVYFNRNDRLPLIVGVKGGSGGANGPSYLLSQRGTVSTGLDLHLYGLQISSGLRYADSGMVGGAQRFLPDAALGISAETPLSDKLRFFTPHSGTIALLPLTDPPLNSSDAYGEAGNGRVSVFYGNANGGQPGTGAGLFLSIFNGYDISHNGVQGVGFIGAPGGAPALAIGPVLNFKVDRVEALGSLQGFANYPNFVSGYPTDVTSSHFGGADAAVYLYFNIAQFRDIVLEPSRGSEIRSWSSANHFQGVTISTGGTSYSHYQAMNDNYGTLNLLEDIRFAGDGSSVESAAFLMYQAAYSNLIVSLDTIAFNSVGTGSLIKLVDMGFTNAVFVPAQFNARHLSTSGSYGYVYESNGSAFHGFLPQLESGPAPGMGFWKVINQYGPPNLVTQ